MSVNTSLIGFYRLELYFCSAESECAKKKWQQTSLSKVRSVKIRVTSEETMVSSDIQLRCSSNDLFLHTSNLNKSFIYFLVILVMILLNLQRFNNLFCF